MRYLVLSDIHSNWEALEAVLADAGRYDQAICCGDLVGYCADPNRVIDWARANLAVVIRGNHDKASAGLINTEWFNDTARAAASWTERQLTPANREYVARLPKGPALAGGFALMHGAPVDEDEYIAELYEAQTAFSYLERAVTFFGHTHLQGGFRHGVRRLDRLRGPSPENNSATLDIQPDTWYLVNPGSVGQPRDADPRSAYAVYDTAAGEIELRRVAYDIGEAQRKIRDAGLPGVLANRLSLGR